MSRKGLSDELLRQILEDGDFDDSDVHPIFEPDEEDSSTSSVSWYPASKPETESASSNECQFKKGRNEDTKKQHESCNRKMEMVEVPTKRFCFEIIIHSGIQYS
ncbi:hypothetical protein MML48_8g00016475 [Holotrichia oblita]|uniref:Uncharacterized protein n=1 Tax=Holotrichia oblita TaxID=644536 RepID=A0ACB9SLJ5_HOLOL|nr:hypothetical protein MML48_8g00016475 [Holotrichia oblita]